MIKNTDNNTIYSTTNDNKITTNYDDITNDNTETWQRSTSNKRDNTKVNNNATILITKTIYKNIANTINHINIQKPWHFKTSTFCRTKKNIKKNQSFPNMVDRELDQRNIHLIGHQGRQAPYKSTSFKCREPISMDIVSL